MFRFLNKFRFFYDLNRKRCLKKLKHTTAIDYDKLYLDFDSFIKKDRHEFPVNIGDIHVSCKKHDNYKYVYGLAADKYSITVTKCSDENLEIAYFIDPKSAYYFLRNFYYLFNVYSKMGSKYHKLLTTADSYIKSGCKGRGYLYSTLLSVHTDKMVTKTFVRCCKIDRDKFYFHLTDANNNPFNKYFIFRINCLLFFSKVLGGYYDKIFDYVMDMRDKRLKAYASK